MALRLRGAPPPAAANAALGAPGDARGVQLVINGQARTLTVGPHDDTDVARAVHSPHGNIHIQSPYLDPSLFNPLATTGTHLASLQGPRRRRRWGLLPRRRPSPLPRLCVPLPVPHPAELSIIIHNRAGEQELPMDLCRPLLRELREVPQPASAEYLSTLREGGTSRYILHLSSHPT